MPLKYSTLIWLFYGFGISLAGDVWANSQVVVPHRYVSQPSGSSIELDPLRLRVVFDGHSVVDAIECKQSLEYKCLIGGDAIFVFPKRMPSEGGVWEYGGHRWKVMKAVVGQIYGRKYSGFLISRQEEVDAYWYIYSPRDGLIAFGFAGATPGGAFFIEGSCGFGANGCRSRLK